MFNKRKHREKMMQMAQQFTPTSKATLKQFCIMASKGNVDESTKLYNFYIEGMEDLPMFDPVPPTVMEKVKGTADGIFGFIRENQDGIMQGVELIRSLTGKKKAVEAAASALPPIND
jgi:hypothetical protein